MKGPQELSNEELNDQIKLCLEKAIVNKDKQDFRYRQIYIDLANIYQERLKMRQINEIIKVLKK